MKKTKIVCTMGPNTDNREIMKELAINGMDVARFNFSHGDHAEHKHRLEILESVREELGIPIASLLDTKGPEIRTGKLKDGKKVTLKEGDLYTLTTEEIVGDETRGYINYAGLAEDVKPGDRILIDDGLIELHVREVNGTDIVCRIENGGELGEKKGVNVPGVRVKLPALTDKDKEDIRFGVDAGFDFVAASFVRNADAISFFGRFGQIGADVSAASLFAVDQPRLDQLPDCTVRCQQRDAEFLCEFRIGCQRLSRQQLSAENFLRKDFPDIVRQIFPFRFQIHRTSKSIILLFHVLIITKNLKLSTPFSEKNGKK